MYAGVEEGGGAVAVPEAGIPYMGFEGSTCKKNNKKTNLKPYLKKQANKKTEVFSELCMSR